MTQPWHDKKSFFKYYTADSAIKTLEETTRKWSSPLEFNDPFDNQFDLQLEQPTEELAKKMVQKIHSSISSDEPLKRNQYGPMTPYYESLRLAHTANPDIEYSEYEMEELTEAMILGMQKAIQKAPEFNAEVRALLADTSIFCLSESNDNLLMWSHYAENHSGAVIEFLSLQEIDSPLILAQPVRYSLDMPTMNFEDLQRIDTTTRAVLETLTLTKSDVWSYEKEWRLVSTLRDKHKSYEILPYAPEEVSAVYLGCKIDQTDKERLLEVTKSKYPKAKVYQAQKNPTKYLIDFEEL